jgi:hypothetical protein
MVSFADLELKETISLVLRDGYLVDLKHYRNAEQNSSSSTAFPAGCETMKIIPRPELHN